MIMSVRGYRKKLNPIGTVALFRVFLWWGTEVIKQVLTYRKPKARIVHLLRSESMWPFTKWVFTNERTCCIISDGIEDGVDIYQFHQVSQN